MTTQTEAISTSQTRTGVLDRVLWISFFTLATALCAFVEIPLPFTPVPITLQTLAVIASGVVLGRDGKWSQALYLLLGGIGLPFFAGGAGSMQSLFGATGGYLIGFVAASALTGKWVHPQWKTLNVWGKSWRLFLTSLVIFIPGVLQLCLVLKVNLLQGLQYGFFPFILGDIVKTFTVALIPNRLQRN